MSDWREYSCQEGIGKSEWDRTPEIGDERRKRVTETFEGWSLSKRRLFLIESASNDEDDFRAKTCGCVL